MLMLRLLILLVLLCPTLSQAQQSNSIDYYDLLVHNNRSVVSDGSNVPVDRANTAVFEVTVTGTAEVLFRISGPGRFGWQALSCTPSDSTSPATSTTTNGLFTCNVAGGEAISARLNTCTACTASVSIRRSTAILGNGGGGGGGVTGWPSTRVSNISFATSLATAAGIGDGTDYWAFYRDPTNGLQFNCVIAGTENGCNYIRKLAATFYYEIQNAGGTSIFRVTNDTGAITNATLDAEGTGNNVTIKAYRWFPAASCQGAVASSIWDLPSSNPAVASCRTGTNTTKGLLDFADGANAITAQLTEYLNEDWSGAIDATIVWQSGSTSTNNVVWQLAIACAGASDSDDPAFTDDVFTADANDATANDYNMTASNTITTTGTCAANKIAHIRVKRDPAHASDNLAATAQLVGVSLKVRSAQ